MIGIFNAIPELCLPSLTFIRPPGGVHYKRSAVIVPLDVCDPMWLHLPRSVRVEHIDTAKGRALEHVRR